MEQNTMQAVGRERRTSRAFEFVLFCTALAWVSCANAIAGRAAQGIAVRFRLGDTEALLEGTFLLFLVVVGFGALRYITYRDTSPQQGSPAADEGARLPLRAGWQTEWGVGAAIGWGLCLLAALPLLLTGNLHTRLIWQDATWQGLALAAAFLLIATVLEEIIFRGYPFQRLIRVIGPSWAAILLSIGFAIVLVHANPPRHYFAAVIDGTLFGLVLAMAYLRTHALWVGWGLHFAYRAVAGMVLGLPVVGHRGLEALAASTTSGPGWLSGGAFGLDAATPTALVLLGGMAVLYRATEDYAWRYTHPPIIPGGYEVTVAPPAAHVAMEKAAAPPPPLVQILAATPQSRSVTDTPESTLRAD